jgi:tetratricopeptide (TPR) repeat protein
LGFALGAITYFKRCLNMGATIKTLNINTDKALMREIPAYSIGRSHRKLGNKEAALEAFTLALLFNPDHEASRKQINELQNQ